MRIESDIRDIFREEELAPHLKGYVTESANGLGQIFHHPLNIHVMYSPAFNRMINLQVAAKTEALKKAEAAEDWHTYVFLHERPYRIDILREIMFDRWIQDPAIVWPLVTSVWVDSENIYQSLDEWMEVWDADIPHRHLAMDANDRAALEKMDDEIVVYRGIALSGSEYGMSWTTDRKRAVWFANRWEGGSRTPTLVRGRVKKANVLAYLSRRNESEIVALPDDVKHQTMRVL
jgi:hypothetical protein